LDWGYGVLPWNEPSPEFNPCMERKKEKSTLNTQCISDIPERKRKKRLFHPNEIESF
jgi:hypothetical protein